jgi:hypothetical protein
MDGIRKVNKCKIHDLKKLLPMKKSGHPENLPVISPMSHS